MKKTLATIFSMLLTIPALAADIVVPEPALPAASPKLYEITTLNLATFDDTGWTQEKIQNQLDAVNAVFLQCNVRVGAVKIHKIKNFQLPKPMNGRVHDAPNGAIAVRKKTAQVPQPAIYLVGDMADSSGFTKAVMKVNAPPCEPELENTIWLPEIVNSPDYQEGRHTRPFATMAHELTHLLTLEGQHNGDRPYNQLAIWKNRTDLMTAEMCEQMHESKFVREIKNTK